MSTPPKVRLRFKTVNFQKGDDPQRIHQLLEANIRDLADQIETGALVGPAGPAGSASTGSLLAAFDPKSISSMLAWLAADGDAFSDAGVTPAANGDALYRLNDKSGNAFHFSQATLANRMSYWKAPSGSARPMISCFDDARFLQRASDAGMTPGSMSVFAAVRAAGDEGTSRNIYSQYHQPSDQGISLGLDDVSPGAYRVTLDGNNILKNSKYTATGDFDVVGATYDSATTNRALWVNGIQVASDAGATLTHAGSLPSIGYLGYLVHATYNWVGEIPEVLLYSKALSKDEAVDLSGYLTRWRNFSRGAA